MSTTTGRTRRVGVATIGQAPRLDVTELMRGYWGDAEVIERGALDSLDDAAIAELAPAPDDLTLATRLRDGREVKIGKRAVTSRVQAVVDALADDEVDVIVVLCTGPFNLTCRKPLALAGLLNDAIVHQLLGGRRLGMIMPAAEQVDPYRETAHAVVWASPYVGDETSWRAAATQLASAGVDLVYLNCMGMREDHKRLVAEVTGRPVILANSLVARIVAEML